MDSNTIKAPISSTDLFEMEIIFSLDNSEKTDIESYLNEIKETYNCELNVSIL
tara:strand:- start:2437 stop:2595 length:159 start_codon:yes stop_codon:yes gene_type:complete